MDERKLREIKRHFAENLDGLTVAEIADQAVRAFYEMADEAERLAHENTQLRRRAA